MNTPEELRAAADALETDVEPMVGNAGALMRRAADELEALGHVATVTCRSEGARERAIAGTRMILELLEQFPDRIEGLTLNEQPTSDGIVGFTLTARVRP